MTDEDRSARIVDTLVEAFADLMARRPGGVPHQVPQDGRRPVRVLPGQRLPVLRRRGRAGRPVGRRAHRPGLDPGRPARGELRHLHGRRRRPDLRRERLRRGLHRALHLGRHPVRGQPGAARLAQGALRRRHHRAGRRLRPGLPRPGPLVRRPGRRPQLLAAPGHHRGRRAPGAAAGQAAHPGRAAGRDHRDRGLRPRSCATGPGVRRLDDDERAAVLRRVRALPGAPSRSPSGCAGSATR